MRRTLARKPQVGKALSSPAQPGRRVDSGEPTRVISGECRRVAGIRFKSKICNDFSSGSAESVYNRRTLDFRRRSYSREITFTGYRS